MFTIVREKFEVEMRYDHLIARGLPYKALCFWFGS